MRLVCPNCGAQYEVDDRVIPEAGRDVQCSACGHAWFQMPQGHEPATEGAPEQDDALPPEEQEEEGEAVSGAQAPRQPEAEPTGEERPPREIDEGVRSILQEEARHEIERRAAEQVETQPDLGLETGPSPDEERRRVARERMARMRGLDQDGSEAEAPDDAASAEEARKAAPRRERFPDIEEINSTLDGPGSSGEAGAAGEGVEKSSGFSRGFFLVIFLAALLLATYILAPQLVQNVPALEPALTAYVEAVNTARAWLEANVQNIIEKIEAAAGGNA